MSYWQTFQTEIVATKHFFLNYLKNPVEAVRRLPDWKWPTIVITNVLTASGSGALAGLVGANALQIAIGAFLFPITSTLSMIVAGSFIYYSSLLFFGKTPAARPLFTLLVIAHFPFMIFHTVSRLLPPIDLLGLAFTFLLLIVGLVDNFKLPRKGTIRLISAVYLVFFLVWIGTQISSFRKFESFNPQSLDRLQQQYYKDR